MEVAEGKTSGHSADWTARVAINAILLGKRRTNSDKERVLCSGFPSHDFD